MKPIAIRNGKIRSQSFASMCVSAPNVTILEKPVIKKQIELPELSNHEAFINRLNIAKHSSTQMGYVTPHRLDAKTIINEAKMFQMA